MNGANDIELSVGKEERQRVSGSPKNGGKRQKEMKMIPNAKLVWRRSNACSIGPGRAAELILHGLQESMPIKDSFDVPSLFDSYYSQRKEVQRSFETI
jgi:hypothetical protein